MWAECSTGGHCHCVLVWSSCLLRGQRYPWQSMPVCTATHLLLVPIAVCCLTQVAGSASFHAVPVETYGLHVHVLKTAGAPGPTHVLVWRPVPVGEAETAADSQPQEFNVGFTAAGVSAAWKLSGVVPDGKEAVPVPVVDPLTSFWTMAVSSIPTLVVLA